MRLWLVVVGKVQLSLASDNHSQMRSAPYLAWSAYGDAGRLTIPRGAPDSLPVCARIV